VHWEKHTTIQSHPQDIENGEGVAVLDPHGDLVDKLLGIIPPERVEDVILIDPSMRSIPSDSTSCRPIPIREKSFGLRPRIRFQRLSSSWGDQMASVLRNASRRFWKVAGWYAGRFAPVPLGAELSE